VGFDLLNNPFQLTSTFILLYPNTDFGNHLFVLYMLIPSYSVS